jgi:sirohydrochlorin ferrochelatase
MSSSDAVTGIIIVDHGSKRETANRMLIDVVARFRKSTTHSIVEAAHMELAEPSIAEAFKNCVDQGATNIVCHPYFLSKGRHYQEDIPALLAAAALDYPGTSYSITEPLGVQEGIIDLIAKSISDKVSSSQTS